METSSVEQPGKNGFLFVDHIADIRVEIRAESPERLFRLALESMMQHMFENSAAADQSQTIIQHEIPGSDLETLLHEFLSFTLSLSCAERCCCNLRKIRFGSASMLVEISCAPAAASREIKAVTYNDLYVKENGGAWLAGITFDV